MLNKILNYSFYKKLYTRIPPNITKEFKRDHLDASAKGNKRPWGNYYNVRFGKCNLLTISFSEAEKVPLKVYSSLLITVLKIGESFPVSSLNCHNSNDKFGLPQDQ